MMLKDGGCSSGWVEDAIGIACFPGGSVALCATYQTSNAS